MSLLARLNSYLLSFNVSPRKIRAENLREVNRRAAEALLEAERAYWRKYLAKCNTDADYEHGMEQLEHLRGFGGSYE